MSYTTRDLHSHTYHVIYSLTALLQRALQLRILASKPVQSAFYSVSVPYKPIHKVTYSLLITKHKNKNQQLFQKK